MARTVKKATPKKAAVKQATSSAAKVPRISSKTFNPEKVMKARTIVEIDWKLVPEGTWFTAKYKGAKITGRVIRSYNTIYLATNETRNNSNVSDKMGFSGAFYLGAGAVVNILNSEISELTLLKKKPSDYKYDPVIVISGHRVKYEKGKIRVGCQTVSNKDVLTIASKLIK